MHKSSHASSTTHIHLRPKNLQTTRQDNPCHLKTTRQDNPCQDNPRRQDKRYSFWTTSAHLHAQHFGESGSDSATAFTLDPRPLPLISDLIARYRGEAGSRAKEAASSISDLITFPHISSPSSEDEALNRYDKPEIRNHKPRIVTCCQP